jgi:hypothetical protein
VNKHGADSYPLVNPAPSLFKDARAPTRTFCNWAAYKVAEYLDTNDIAATHSFIHFRAKDSALLDDLFAQSP